MWAFFENSFRRPYGSCTFGTSSFAHVQAVSTFFLSFYDASIVLLRNLGTTKMDPQNKCFFHANFYFKSGFWPTSLQRKIVKFAQVFFQTYQRREKCNMYWSLYRNSDIWYLENKRMTLLKKWNLCLFHLLVQKYFDHAHIFLTVSTIFWTLSNIFDHGQKWYFTL